ncbi:MAG: A17 family peptidase, partial [Providencia heimbachae]|nr:A17 family peptidase [Providencia heimbachae]
MNDVLYTGPKLQQELFSILLRFRCHRFVFIADIIKMYRQILVTDKHQDFQRILWRDSPNENIKCYKLTTVTYGTSCAPYLAIRCLNKLAEDGDVTHPQAAKIILSDCYVDDVITGADTIDECAALQKELINLLQTGGFKLHKWSSNCSKLLESIPSADRELKNLSFTDEQGTIKALGLLWNPFRDTFQFSAPNSLQSPYTKRSILSSIAKIFDPLGLLAPVVLKAKLIIQELWKNKLDWDDTLPLDIQNRWKSFLNQFQLLTTITVPRCLFSTANISSIQYHGFADASMLAYGACIFVRVTYTDGSVSVRLFCAKSKVAPVKNVTLPRLELCAALLLSRLYKHVIGMVDLAVTDTYLWSDSTIVLSWLRTDPNRLRMFVSNRVAEIQDSTNGTLWRHVPSEYNPADIISRGSTAAELKNSDLWWNGPDWLALNNSHWPCTIPSIKAEIPEQRVLLAKRNTDYDFKTIYNKISSFTKLVRVIAYCLRISPKHRQKLNWGSQNTISTTELH